MKRRPAENCRLDGLTPPPGCRLHAVPNLDRRGTSNAKALGVALLLAGVLTPLESAPAQKRGDRVRVLAGTALRAAPGGQVVGVLSRTYEAPVEMVQGTAVRLKLNGFVNEQDLRLESNGSRGLMGASNARGEDGGTLRTGRGENEPALATLQRGAVVFPGQKAASFFAVNRTVWVDKSRLAKFTGPSGDKPSARTAVASNAGPDAGSEPVPKPASVPPVQSSTTVPSRGAADNARTAAPQGTPPLQTNAASPLRAGPNGAALLQLPAGIVVTPLATESGWTRVRVDGWMLSSDLGELDSKGSSSVSAADLRADPDGMKGRIVRWTVENLSYQLADGLRRELNGEPYILARGPGNERAILYLAVPDSLVERARALAPLSTIDITARVRSGRSQPGGVPILDLVELLKR